MTNNTENQNRLLTTEQAAEYLNMAPATLHTWRSTKRNVIPYVKLGGRFVRYEQADLDAFIKASKQGAMEARI